MTLIPRVYTVAEIEDMRRAVRCIAEMGPYWHHRRHSPGLSGPDITAAEVEERLRTYLLQGTAPEELIAEADRVFAIKRAAVEERKKKQAEQALERRNEASNVPNPKPGVG